MRVWFWMRRFVLVAAAASAIVGIVHWAKGNGIEESVGFGLGWGILSAAIFVAGRMYASSRGRHCAICRDTPEMRTER